MVNENISKKIKEIRTKNKLTQNEFAEKLGVTFQAVSKWENGKNIPDLETLYIICNEFNLDISELIGTKKNNKKEKKLKKIIYMLLAIIILVISIFTFYITTTNKDDYKFETIKTTCSNFKISGSMAYTKDKSTIYISNIVYCGEEDNNKYDSIEAILYKEEDKTETKIGEYKYKENIILNDYLESLEIKANTTYLDCKNLINEKIYLVIKAKLKDKEIRYEIPLQLSDKCA